MSSPKVVPLPVWRTPRRTAVLFVILGTLVVLFGVGLYLESLDLEGELAERPEQQPRPSESSPTNTSS